MCVCLPIPTLQPQTMGQLYKKVPAVGLESPHERKKMGFSIRKVQMTMFLVTKVCAFTALLLP